MSAPGALARDWRGPLAAVLARGSGANPYWTKRNRGRRAADDSCIGQVEAGGSAPTRGRGPPRPGVYGVPDQWPHIRALYERAGFVHTGHTEMVYLAWSRPGSPGRLPDRRAVRPPVGRDQRNPAVRHLGDEVIGYIEVETLEAGERLARHGGWADIGNLQVAEQYRRQGVARGCLARQPTGCGWPRWSGFSIYAWLDGEDVAGQDYAGYRGQCSDVVQPLQTPEV